MTSISGVEIFAVGKWNGHSITKQTLADIVDAFKSTRETVKPVLKLGHNNSQKLLEADGLPAAGWVSNVYIQGNKLLADFVDIPKKIAQLIKNKSYRKVSIELFSGVSLKGKKYPNLLSAVALLGADTPAVLSLADIPTDFSMSVENVLNFTKDEKDNSIEKKTFDSKLKIPGVDMENKELLDLIDSQKKELEELKNQSKEFASNSEKLKEAEKQISDLKALNEKAEIEKFSLDLQSKDLISPSMKPYIEALCGEDKKEFSINDKKLSKNELIEGLLGLAKEVFKISTKEHTDDKKNESKDSAAEQLEKVEKYMAEHKVDFSQAYKALNRKEA